MKLSLLVFVVFQGVMQIERSRRVQHARQASGIRIAFFPANNDNSPGVLERIIEAGSSDDGATIAR
jgi:hypothetical protein